MSEIHAVKRLIFFLILIIIKIYDKRIFDV